MKLQHRHVLLSALAVIVFLLTGCSLFDKFETGDTRVIHLLRPENFYSYIKEFGVESDPDHVFTWETNNVLHVSGQYYGYLATRESYSNYTMIVEFKWGNKTWAPRENNARDGGVLCHFVGKDAVWPKSLEAQLIEGGSGDILVVSGAYLTIDGVRKGPAIARFDRPGRNPWQDVKGFRGPNEIEKPLGEWNTMEVNCMGDHFGIKINGHKTLEGTNAIPNAGKILLQSEGAEVFFRRVDLYPKR